jgi:hypothetical protein
MAKTDRLNDAHRRTSRFFPPGVLALHVTEPPRPRTRRLFFQDYLTRRSHACLVTSLLFLSLVFLALIAVVSIAAN